MKFFHLMALALRLWGANVRDDGGLLAREGFIVRLAEAATPGQPNLATVKYSSLRYNKPAARYIDGKGRFIPPDQVRKIIDNDIDATQKRMMDLAARLRAKRINLQEFRDGMAQEIKHLHLAEVAAGQGGIHNMGAAEWGRAGERIKYHTKKLDAMVLRLAENPEFIDEIRNPVATGKMDLMRHVELFAQAGRNTYERQNRANNQKAGYKKERSIRNKDDSCEECITCAKRGKVKIGTNPLPGDRECGPRCGCKMRYYKR